MEHPYILGCTHKLIDTAEWLLIIEKFNEKNRKNILFIINIIYNNKNKFRKANALTEYNKIMINLYKLVETMELDNNFISMLEKIKTFKEFINSPTNNIILEKLPLLYYCIDINTNYLTELNYQIQIEPIKSSSYSRHVTVMILTFLLSIINDCKISSNQIFIVLTLYDFIFRNFQFIEDNKQFGIVFYKKLLEFINNENVYERMKTTLKNKDIDENTLDIWKYILEEKKVNE